MNNDLGKLTDQILRGEFKRIVILSGAGVSTNAGIPDYRSKEGIFAQLVASNEYPDARSPEDYFTRQFADRHPEFRNNALVKEFKQQMLNAQPTISHKFAKWLHDRGVLRRVYTQNVDGLYQKAGLSDELVVEYHGNYSKGTTVLYGDQIPALALYQTERDFVHNTETDLLIVMGSSLQVSPFCAIPNLVSRNCTRVLVDLTPERAMENAWSKQPQQFTGLANATSWTKFGNRRVSLRPEWNDLKKRPQQYIFTADCDLWADAIMSMGA